jgi:amidase
VSELRPATELLFKPVTELTALVRAREVSAGELVELSLERIEALDGELNAFVLVDSEGARKAAAEIDRGAADDARPFAGVPIAIKDESPVAGLRMTVASELFGDFTPAHDSHVVRRIKEAGFVIVGKTNLPEFGILPVTEPRRFGPTRNPWDTERTPGGSSGGAAAAVAAGMVPIAHGADGGGSLRIPASCCGLVGLKVARGRISRGPELGEHFLTHDGVLTRTVADTAAVLDLLGGYETGDATWAPPPGEPFAESAASEPGRLRVRVTLDPPIEAELDPQAERAVREAAELLASLGHDVDYVEAPWKERGNLLPLFTRVFAVYVALGVFFGGQVSGRDPAPELVEPLSWELWRRVQEQGALDFLLAKTELQGLARSIVGLWERDCDVMLTPALARRPLRIGEIDPCSDDPWSDYRASGAFTPYTSLFNVTGQPAISLPLFQGDDGLPLAVQLAGPPAGEGLLLSLAAQLEAERPWADRRPQLAIA